jgi:hypothetical protein
MENKLLFTGKITGVGSVKSGEKNGKAWARVEFGIQEVKEKYPQSFKLSLYKNGDNVKYVNSFATDYPVGTIATVEIHGKVSNFDGKTYNNLGCWRIDKVSDNQSAPEQHDDEPLFKD